MPSADMPVRRRTFAFTEYQRAKNSKTDFYITEISRPDAIIEPYPMHGAPASVVEVEPNSVEEWTILNFTHELHNFHIHQLHFRVLESDDKFVEGRMLDTINVPVALPDANWSPDDPVTPGKVRLLMRFHQNISGEFVFHCHILSHEDKGMMGLIRVVDPVGEGRRAWNDVPNITIDIQQREKPDSGPVLRGNERPATKGTSALRAISRGDPNIEPTSAKDRA